jgi:NAD(P)-dependent dehydrogenase (short-subunit alcohol dehydrogenase family)
MAFRKVPRMNGLDSKRVVLSGAASGIGRAIASRLASERASVMMVDLDPRGAEVASALGMPFLEADVSVEADVERVFAASMEAFGGLDGAVANAGILGGIPSLEETAYDEFRRVVDVNLGGTFLFVRALARHLRAEGRPGSMVCTASVAGLRAAAGPAHYSASKAGVIGLVKTAAHQLQGTGIRVNAVCPGLVETGMTQFLFDGARRAGKADRIGQLNPLGRAGEPEEIAAVVAFLLSDESSYVNGQAVAVDGGLSASHPFVPGSKL